MRIFRRWLAALGLAFLAAAAAYPAQAQDAGYRILEASQPTNTGNKIEVIEFFGYFCSHCYSFDPHLKQWAKKQGNNVVFKRVHVGFGESMRGHQKMFYTLDAMGKLEELHPKIFQAIQSGQQPLRRDEQIFDFVAKNGVDKTKFIEIYNSPWIASLTQAAAELQSLFKVDGVPLIAIDGRYITSPALVAGSSLRRNMSEAELQTATLSVMDALVDKAKKEKGLDAGKRKK